jgi:carbon-monoxide dehydrogenase medium subunit
VSRKTGEFATAIGAVLFDPARAVCRAAIGATESRPVVFSDAGALLRGGSEAGLSPSFDQQPARAALAAAGMTDTIGQQIHLVALRRAIEQACA